MKVDRSAASRLGVYVHLPRLAKGVRLDEMALVVNMKAVLGGVFFEVGDEAGDVDGHLLRAYCCRVDWARCHSLLRPSKKLKNEATTGGGSFNAPVS